MTKSLDTKIADILANPSGSKAFIVADAKDADMAFGVAAPGPRRAAKTNDYESDWKTLEDFRAQIRDVVRQGIVDIMLLSASNVEILAMEERLLRTLRSRLRRARTIPPISGPCAAASTRARHRDRFARRRSTISCTDASIPSPTRK
jgi:hypothetical protein